MDAIAKSLNQALIDDKIDLLRQIANDFGLDVDDLIEKYIHNNARHSAIKKPCQKKKRQDYIETEEFTFNGVKYLVDIKNQVYTYNIEKPMMVGERLVDGSVKFFEAYLTQL